MVKHTAGPWTVESVSSEALHDICLDYRIPGAGHPLLVATCFDDDESGPGRISPIEAQANARLIAAAPDLLAASEAMLEALDGSAAQVQFAAGRLRAAIAKATAQ